MTNPDATYANRAVAETPSELGVEMYIEEKPGLAGHARIGRVRFSNSRRTVYYRGRKLQSLNGSGYKANYFNVESGLEYWGNTRNVALPDPQVTSANHEVREPSTR